MELTEAEVIDILSDAIDPATGNLDNMRVHYSRRRNDWYLNWQAEDNEATLDGNFTPEALEAIAWWMKHKKK